MADHIQIGDITPRIQYTGDGAQTAFTYPFPIFADADLDVYEGTTLKALTTHYSVSGAGDSNGGTVTFGTAPANGVVVTIARNLSIARTTDFQESGEFRASVLNDELDKQTAFIQQVDDRVDRSVQLPSTSTSTADLSLPDPEADKLLGWNAAADGLENKAPEVTGATASTLAEGAPATASYDDATGVIAFGIPVGATGDTGAAGADGSDGLFSGAEATVSVATGDLVAIKDTSDSGNPKFVTAQGIADLAVSEDQVARDLALTAYIKADIASADPAGVYGDIMSDNFTSDTLATQTNATYDAAGDFYDNRGITTTTSSSSDWDDPNATATFTGDDITFALDDSIKSVVTFTGDFTLDFTLNTGDYFRFGFWDTANDGSFNANSSVFMPAATNVWRVDNNNNQGLIYYGSTQVASKSGGFQNGDVFRFTRESGVFKIFVNDMVTPVHTWSQTFTGTVRMGGGDTSTPRQRMDNISWSVPTGVATDMTLRPTAVTLPTGNPLDMSMYFRVRDIDAVTEGTDRVVKASIDGGTTWATATITSLGDYGSTDKLIRADADVSAQTGSSFVWEVTTANSKEQQIKQVASVAGY